MGTDGVLLRDTCVFISETAEAAAAQQVFSHFALNAGVSGDTKEHFTAGTCCPVREAAARKVHTQLEDTQVQLLTAAGNKQRKWEEDTGNNRM